MLIFLIELNVNQMQCNSKNQKNNLPYLHSLDGAVQSNTCSSTELSATQIVFNHLVNWEPPQKEVFLVHHPPTEILKTVSIGCSTATLVWKWLQTIQWTTDVESDHTDPHDWGITYFEVVINFLICTGEALPIAINVGERYVQYCRYWSLNALMFPPRTRAANIQVYTMEKLLRQF